MKKILIFVFTLGLLIPQISMAGKKSKKEECATAILEISENKKTTRQMPISDDEYIKPILKPRVVIRGVEFIRETDPQSEAETTTAIVRLLNASGDLPYHRAEYREANHKGELHLAEYLADGTRLLLAYKADEGSTAQLIYRLVGINLILKNGQSIKLTDNPVIDEGVDLRQTRFLWAVRQEGEANNPLDVETEVLGDSETDRIYKKLEKRGIKVSEDHDLYTNLKNNLSRLNPADQKALVDIAPKLETLSIPVVVYGKVLQEYLKWMPRFNNISSIELRDIENLEDLRKLYWFKYVPRKKWNDFYEGGRNFLNKSPTRAIFWLLLGLSAGRVMEIGENLFPHDQRPAIEQQHHEKHKTQGSSQEAPAVTQDP